MQSLSQKRGRKDFNNRNTWNSQWKPQSSHWADWRAEPRWTEARVAKETLPTAAKWAGRKVSKSRFDVKSSRSLTSRSTKSPCSTSPHRPAALHTDPAASLYLPVAPAAWECWTHPSCREARLIMPPCPCGAALRRLARPPALSLPRAKSDLSSC